jgi:hypothetical protein
MAIKSEQPEVLAVKDGESERPIPTAWRPIIREIVHALANEDYRLISGINGVTPFSAETADRIREYIQDYGATLTELPDETWNSSVCRWMGNRWDALIDLWTESEGRSDLVLRLNVSEVKDGFVFSMYMVYVP